MKLSYGLNLPRRGLLMEGHALGGFLFSHLFANGEKGVWFDPSDLSTLFQDVAGTQPVTAPAQTVALELDKSGNGHHATQATSSQRPTYGIVPKTGRRNLLTYTEDFSNEAWNKNSGATTPSAKTASFTADTLSRLTQGVTVASAASLTLSVRFSTSDAGKVVRLGLWASGLDGLAAGNSGNLTIPASGVVSFTWTSVTSVTAIGIINSSAATAQTLTLAEGGGAQLELGSTPTAYQKVVSPYEVTEAGVPSLSYLYKDPIDDSLISTLPDLGTDATVAYATEAGTTILTGQTIGAGAFEVLKGTYNYGLVVVDRPMTVQETTNLTAYLDARRPT